MSRYLVMQDVNGHCCAPVKKGDSIETYVTEDAADARVAALMASEPTATFGVYRRVSYSKPKVGYEKVTEGD